jgi:hypothetical protein
MTEFWWDTDSVEFISGRALRAKKSDPRARSNSRQFLSVTLNHGGPLVELYRADIEEDRAEALVCYAFVVADENTATGRHNQPTKVVVLAGVGRVTLLLLSEYDTLNVN